MIDIVMIVYLLIVVSFCSYTDWKRFKIYNKTILFAFIPSIVFVIIYYIRYPDYFTVFITNMVSAFVIGIVFFALKIWGAGDSKLWIFINFLYPGKYYLMTRYMLFPSMIVLMFIFVEAFVYVVGESVYIRLLKKDIGIGERKITVDKNWIINLTFSMAVLSFIYSLLGYILKEYFEANQVFFALIGFALSMKLTTIKRKAKLVVIMILLPSFFVLLFMTNQTPDLRMYLLSLLLILLSQWGLHFADKYNYMWIPTSSVKCGMILSIISVQMMLGSRVKGLPRFTDETTKCRLSEAEADAVRRWERSKTGKEYVMIVRYIPFAVFMLIGIISYLAWEMIIV